MKIDWSLLPGRLLESAIVLVAAIVIGKVVKKLLRKASRHHADDKKARTLNSVFGNFFSYLLYFIAIVMILSIFGINTSSLIASAGIIGIAIGLGAQSLVKDIINGIFILFDNYFAVGDYVDISGYKGFVEEIGMRSSKIRDWNGELHIFPNGSINGVTNYCKGEVQAILEISVDNRENLHKVWDVLQTTCEQMETDFKEKLDDGPTVWGLQVLDEYKMTLRMAFKCNLRDEGSLTRELRKRCKIALDNAQIHMPQPRQWVYTAEMGEDNREQFFRN